MLVSKSPDCPGRPGSPSLPLSPGSPGIPVVPFCPVDPGIPDKSTGLNTNKSVNMYTPCVQCQHNVLYLKHQYLLSVLSYAPFQGHLCFQEVLVDLDPLFLL